MSDAPDDTPTAPEKPAGRKPAAQKPAGQKPAAQKPAAQKPTAKQPAAQKPASEKPASEKPAAKQPAAKKPAAAAAKKPTDGAAVAGASASAGTAATATKPVPEQNPAPEQKPDGKPAQPSTSATTAVIPPGPDVVVVPAPPKKRRRWPWVLGGILLVLAILLVVAFFIADNYAKNYAKDYIKERIVAVLGVEDPSTVTVDIGDGSVLFQAIAGRLNDVDVSAEEVTFGTLTGAATVHAEGVPLDAKAATQKLDVTFSMPEDQVASALGSSLSGLELESVTLEEPEIVIASTLDLFFFKLPVGMGIEPSADEGQIVFTPTTITLGETDYTPDELRQELGNLADPLLAQQSVCVDESLPVALTIVDVDVVGKDLVLKIDGDGVVMGGTDLSTPGTCAD